MDFCLAFGSIAVFGFLAWILAILSIDADLLTIIYTYFGKSLDGTFADKVVWVTGASSGIGEAVSKELAKHRTKIVISARRVDELNRVKRECLELSNSLTDADILVLPLDMTDYSSHQSAFKKVLDHFGRLDILVSNAGRSQRANWEEIETEVDKQLFDLNVFSLLALSRIVLKYFYRVGKGHLVVMSSVAGKNGIPFSASYTASKYALHGYFACLRNEIASKNIAIPVTLICPGPVFSGFLKEAFTAKKDQKFGQDVPSTHKRMSAQRCSYLTLTAIANELEECWVSIFPYLQLTYLSHYQPYLAGCVWKWLSSSGKAMKMRDGRESIQKVE
ncbi:Dehydrogenase/reductase SDR family member 7 [Orchesella cincta]|uniref:Dehydrogenase/reductase SDR family member 7 n=1 Tax=Orchesella cincta TaxID=48709 RepID=A0A1D2MP94_ORCCI|nr:Dehydrogenase/reductase SDR family member 7 [Orchesella cincta]